MFDEERSIHMFVMFIICYAQLEVYACSTTSTLRRSELQRGTPVISVRITVQVIWGFDSLYKPQVTRKATSILADIELHSQFQKLLLGHHLPYPKHPRQSILIISHPNLLNLTYTQIYFPKHICLFIRYLINSCFARYSVWEFNLFWTFFFSKHQVCIPSSFLKHFFTKTLRILKF